MHKQCIHFFSCLRLPQSHQTCDPVTTEKCWNRCQIVERTCHRSYWSWVIKSVCDLSAITSRRQVIPPIACGRTTKSLRDCVSSSRTISSSTSHKLFRLVVRPIGDASRDLHLLSLTTIGGTCNRAITKMKGMTNRGQSSD